MINLRVCFSLPTSCILTTYGYNTPINNHFLKLTMDILLRDLVIVTIYELRQEGECKWLVAGNAIDLFISPCFTHVALLSRLRADSGLLLISR